jgi:hypothetical protein
LREASSALTKFSLTMCFIMSSACISFVAWLATATMRRRRMSRGSKAVTRSCFAPAWSSVCSTLRISQVVRLGHAAHRALDHDAAVLLEERERIEDRQDERQRADVVRRQRHLQRRDHVECGHDSCLTDRAACSA